MTRLCKSVETIMIVLIEISLYYFDIGSSNSCIIYEDAIQCNIQSKCVWDESLSKCVCNSIIAQDVVIIMDSSGSVQAEGWEIQKAFVLDIISTAIPSSSPIGIVQFASNAWIRYELIDDQNRSKILQTVESLEYTRGWTYMKDAVSEAIYLFTTQSMNPQRRLVLITDGNPMPISQTPCDLRLELDALGVDVMIIGVGASWSRARIDCLVKRQEDIIEVSSFTNDAFKNQRNETDEFLCRDISFLLTEIKPVLGNRLKTPYHPIPFIEFYNNAKDIDLNLYTFRMEGIFNGYMTIPNNIIQSIYGSNWPYGTYLVLFDNTNDIINNDTAWCFNCICQLIQPSNHLCNESIYIACNGILCSYNGNNVSVDKWNIAVYDNTESIQRLIMNIWHGMGSNPWRIIEDGYSYELIDKTDSCLPTDGICWKQSCTIYGTPGWNPINCDTICVDDNCQIGGDLNATCNITTGFCECKDYCYNINGLPSCNCIVAPINCTIILDTDYDETPGLPAGDASWSKPNIDWSKQYTLWYQVRWFTFQNDEHLEIIRATPINQRALTLTNMEYRNANLYKQEVQSIVDFGNNEIYSSEWTLCLLKTMSPTISPTPSPTLGLPPIDECNVTIRSGINQYITIDIEWTSPDISAMHTFNKNQFNNKYKLYFTQKDVYIAGTDNLDVLALKVYNKTFYTETLQNNYNATQLIIDGKYEIKVSVVIHEINDTSIDLDDIDSTFDNLMYQQSTICKWYSYSPTLSPTYLPTLSPTNNPSKQPTLTPTLSPTYSWYVLEECMIIIRNKMGNDWSIIWKESNPFNHSTLPDLRRIYVIINKTDELLILNADQFSPQHRDGLQIINPIITNITIELIAEQLIKGNDPTLWVTSPYKTLCEIQTFSPTISPTKQPTSKQPTNSPISIPTNNPTLIPTLSPTYSLPIDWCHVLILNNISYKITFKVPHYEQGISPSINNIKYVIQYNDNIQNSIIAKQTDLDIINITDIIFTSNDITISYNTNFKMTTMSRDSSLIYADWTDCIIFTKSPTLSPTNNPTLIPTLSPTRAPIAVFVYSDDDTICNGDERCACHVDKFNYQCIGSDYPHLTQIEHYKLHIVPLNNVPVPLLFLGRYPYNLPYDVNIEWEFVYLNDSNDFDYGRRIKPIRGITKITANEYLGEVVSAEFVPMPNEQNIRNPQWYRFEIKNCRVSSNYNRYIECSAIYPSWTYIQWIPPEFFEAYLIGGGEPWPDWIFYLLLAASVTSVVVAYLIFVYFKNRNLKNNVDAQNLQSVAMLTGIAPSAHVITQ